MSDTETKTPPTQDPTPTPENPVAATPSAAPTKQRPAWIAPVLVLVVGLLAGLGWAGWTGYAISGPHKLWNTRAILPEDVTARIIERAKTETPPRKMSEAIERALDMTDDLLKPGQGSESAQRQAKFPIAEGQRGNSHDYAHTFAKVLETYLTAMEIQHRVIVVESGEASTLGVSFGSYGWVLVQELRANYWLDHHVDPLLHDRLGAWKVFSRIQGEVPLPKPGEGMGNIR